VALTTSATTAIAINRTASAISTVPRPIGDCAAAGGVAGATVCTIGAEDVASELSVALLDTVDDGDDVAALSVVWLTAVAVPDVVDELADDAVDGSDDDDPADDPGAEADELGELVAVSGVAVAPEEDCSGAASPAWTEVPVASAVAFKTGTMAVAARTVRIANTAAATARVRASGRARPTAITASEHCRPHTRFVGGRSGSVSDPPPVARHRPNVALIGRRVYAKPAPVGCANAASPCHPSKLGTATLTPSCQSGDAGKGHCCRIGGGCAPHSDQAKCLPQRQQPAGPVLTIMDVAISPGQTGELSTLLRVRFLSRGIQ
jgi:hypothetical protein